MGITGTDVAKEASDVVLTDDNFTSIVNAVEEGRGIYDNIKNFVSYLVSCNVGEVLTILFGLLLGLAAQAKLESVVFPLQILMMNILTDGLPALALGVEPVDKDIMQRKPRKPNEKIFSGHAFFNILSVGIVITTGTLWIFTRYIDNPIKAAAMAFTSLVVFQMYNVFNSRAGSESIFKKGLFSNKYLILAVLASLGLHMVSIYTPLSNIINKGQVFLSLGDWGLVILVGSSVIIIEELIKRTFLKEEFLNGGA
jgi:Ca2+-transporting ATPase